GPAGRPLRSPRRRGSARRRGPAAWRARAARDWAVASRCRGAPRASGRRPRFLDPVRRAHQLEESERGSISSRPAAGSCLARRQPRASRVWATTAGTAPPIEADPGAGRLLGERVLEQVLGPGKRRGSRISSARIEFDDSLRRGTRRQYPAPLTPTLSPSAGKGGGSAPGRRYRPLAPE